jgi:hypothetical protein
MTWVLATVVAALVVAVAALALLMGRLSRRVEQLQRRLESSSDAQDMPRVAENLPLASLDGSRAEFVITGLGVDEPDLQAEPLPTVEARLFGDLVLREAVVQTASLVHGVRRALSAETRNRIRFEMRREVKRSRKQRRSDLREARRQWEARQRAGISLEAEDPEDSAA